MNSSSNLICARCIKSLYANVKAFMDLWAWYWRGLGLDWMGIPLCWMIHCVFKPELQHLFYTSQMYIQYVQKLCIWVWLVIGCFVECVQLWCRVGLLAFLNTYIRRFFKSNSDWISCRSIRQCPQQRAPTFHHLLYLTFRWTNHVYHCQPSCLFPILTDSNNKIFWAFIRWWIFRENTVEIPLLLTAAWIISSKGPCWNHVSECLKPLSLS